jgi:hypothetical protein
MIERTRPATWKDVAALATYLNEAGARYALIGGYAVALHGLNRLSEDVDLLVGPDPGNTRLWITALSRACRMEPRGNSLERRTSFSAKVPMRSASTTSSPWTSCPLHADTTGRS